MKLAIIDLDGVLADNTARFAKAEEARNAFYDANRQPGASAAVLDRLIPALERGANDVYWCTAFTPDLVALDTLIDGVLVDLDSLLSARYRIILLTSRPESMRQSTEQWLTGVGIEVSAFGEDFGYPLIMKPASQQYVKTVTWKLGVVGLLVRLFGVDELLFVDDEVEHRNAVTSLDLSCTCRVAENMRVALDIVQ